MLHHSELVNIEEETILAGNRTMVRRFTLSNRANKLSLGILASGGSICSCKVDQGQQEIILPVEMRPRDVESYPPASEWQSHVLGPDSLLLTASSSQSLTYQLNSNNELSVTGRLRHLQAMSPFYMNLNSVREATNVIDGHFLHIRSMLSTPFSVTGDAKFNLLDGVELNTPFKDDGSPFYGLIQDTIYTISVAGPSLSLPQNPSGSVEQPPPQQTEDAIIASLSFMSQDGVSNKIIEVNLSSNGPSTPILKLRVRIKGDGVSLMPVQMNDFKCIYRIRC